MIYLIVADASLLLHSAHGQLHSEQATSFLVAKHSSVLSSPSRIMLRQALSLHGLNYPSGVGVTGLPMPPTSIRC